MIVYLEIELERLSGKFASRDDLVDELTQLVDVGSVYVDESEYEIVSVSEYTLPKKKPATRKREQQEQGKK